MKLKKNLRMIDKYKNDWLIDLYCFIKFIYLLLFFFSLIFSFRFERHQNKLRQIETDFGGEISLVDPARKFVKKESLIKYTRDKKKVEYCFFLFNDILLYASEGLNRK